MVDEKVLASYRAQIDIIDSILMQVLAQRFAVATQVAHVKKQHQLPARLPQRIAQVQQQAEALAAQTGVPVALARVLWQNIIEHTCQHEEQLEVTPR